MSASPKKKVALVLGSGGARGWAHIGVINELLKAGLKPDLVVGTSIGSLVGAMYAAGAWEAFNKLVEDVDWRQLIKIFAEFHLPRAGLHSGSSIVRWMAQPELLGTKTFDALQIPFAAVATDLYRHEPVVLKQGQVVDAVRASISIPGVFDACALDGRILVDGGLVEPVPIQTAHDMGADTVIAVNINPPMPREKKKHVKTPPNMMTTLTLTMRLVETALTDYALERVPAQVLLTPRTENIQTLDFYGGRALISRGEEVVKAHLAQLTEAFE